MSERFGERRAEPMGPGPQRGPSARERQTPEAIRVERIIDHASARLNRMVAANPAMRQYIPLGSVGDAGRVLRGVSSFLRGNPQLAELLTHQSRRDGTGKTTMLVVPGLPLILADTGTSITAVAPVLSCTRNAIDQEFPKRFPDTYDLLASEGGLDDVLWEQAVSKPGMPFDFDPATMEPADYLALAVKTFRNEPFRLRFAKGDTTFTPLN